ncbi:MAG: Asp-tRNA(Asn)/Glu-tRNA(Gln) amidotransferase subunit GatA [Deltaproteobacteria bacterium]|nr:Asp-tRNA(Asn)/Glu-tRNA(Gln) amidotransferase subunit GatA [Deltaproteobacteria bacterium]
MSNPKEHLYQKTAFDLVSGFKNKQWKAAEIAESFLNRALDTNKKLNSFICIPHESILDHATLLDEKRNSNEDLGSLACSPIAIKDILCTSGISTTCGSKILQNFTPYYDATVVEKLKDKDALIFGKTNLDEFAMGSSNENSFFGPVRNPWNLDCVAGGSSGGSAAAVAGQQCAASLGSDTGGSIRLPASFCGVVGVKPSYGRVSRFGLIAFASSLDQVGVFTKDVRDSALLLRIISGQDSKDSTSSSNFVPHFLDSLSIKKKWRIGLPKEYFQQGLDSEVRQALSQSISLLGKNKFEIEEVSLPHSDLSIAAYYLIATGEASSNLSRFDGVRYGYRASNPKNLNDLYKRTRSDGFGYEVKRRIMLGTFALSSGYYDAYYKKASQVRTLIIQDFQKAFEKVDLLLTPTAPFTAFKIGEKTKDPIQMYLTDIYTTAVNLAGLPALSMPCGFDSKKLPIGLQLIAPRFEEERMFQMAHYLEKEFHVQNSKHHIVL